jgi:hypothetical protein
LTIIFFYPAATAATVADADASVVVRGVDAADPP